MFQRKPTKPAKFPTSLVWLLVFVLLMFSGVTYRVLASKLNVDTPIKLPMSLSTFPKEIGEWSGKDVPIPENIKQVARNDDFINRSYVNQADGQRVNFYIAYTARPRTMIGHRPEVCYVGGGWIHNSTESSEVISDSGKKIPVLIHRFHWPSSEYKDQVVLNFYIVNGHISTDDSVFSGIGWRTPNIKGDPARFVAQVQISSVLEEPVRKAAHDMAELLLDFFPDNEEQVKEMDYFQTGKGLLQ